MRFPSLPVMHREVCERFGRRAAVRFKRDGLFHDISFQQYRSRADAAAVGLAQLGVKPGDRIALLSENRHEWLAADHAILSAGAINVPLHATLSAKQVEYQVGHSDSRGVILSNADQAAKLHEVLDALPNVEFVITFDAVSTEAWSLPVMTWHGLMHRGRQAGPTAFDDIYAREKALSGEDISTIIYTSGTTGNPKGVMLTHSNLGSNIEATFAISIVDDTDIMLSWLPYSHVYARTVDHYVTTIAGMTLCLADSIDTLAVNLQEIRPTWMTAVPRFYEKVWTSVEHLDEKEREAELRRFFGDRIRQLSSGGAPLPKHVCAGFRNAGLPLVEGYGLTESSPVICFNRLEDYRVGTVGKTIPGVEVKIAEDGEILTRGPHVMKGYWKNPEATAETIVDGWLMTGDIGSLDEDGFLSITDRKKDLIITSGGKNIAPSELERLLISDVYVDQAIVYGDGRKFVSALIVPNQEYINRECEQAGWTIEVRDEFIQTEAIHDFFRPRIDAVMEAVSPPERVKKYVLLARPLELESDELTATLKVRRRHVIDKYERVLAGLYDD